jgi:hypothetical protein
MFDKRSISVDEERGEIDINSAVIAARLVLQLERVPCLPR